MNQERECERKNVRECVEGGDIVMRECGRKNVRYCVKDKERNWRGRVRERVWENVWTGGE